VRFLLDAHLSPALTDWLRAHGCEAVHVREIGMRSAPDRAIWDEAIRTNAIIITKDHDFARRKAALRSTLPTVIVLRIGNCTTSDLLECWRTSWSDVRARLLNGQHLLFVDRSPE
jgi:predicted nuclease of predicted toxin-antitoxin system